MSKVVKLHIEPFVKQFLIIDLDYIEKNYGFVIDLVKEYSIGLVNGNVVTSHDVSISYKHHNVPNVYRLQAPTFDQLLPLMALNKYISSTAADVVAEYETQTVGRESYSMTFEDGKLRHKANPVNYYRYGVSNAPYTAYGLRKFAPDVDIVRTMFFVTVPGNAYDDTKIAFTTGCEFSSEEREMIDKWISFINENVPPLHKVTLGIHEGKMFIVDIGRYYPSRDSEADKVRCSELIVRAINQCFSI